jgi:hypothetical protein
MSTQIALKNSAVILEHRFHSCGYRTYWQGNSRYHIFESSLLDPRYEIENMEVAF